MKKSLLTLGKVLDRNHLKQINGGHFDHLEHEDDDEYTSDCEEGHCHFYRNGLGYCYRC
ncbi:hypothetical protein [Aquimarina litoralis]